MVVTKAVDFPERVPADICLSVFVNGRSRSVIMEDIQRRIERGDIKQERLDAIQVRPAEQELMLTRLY